MGNYHFFWRSILSQWARTSFLDGTYFPGYTFTSCEQYMMACKALLFQDQPALIKILAEKSPRECKALGRSVKNFNKAVWEQHARLFVRRGNFLRAKADRAFRERLCELREHIIVEASPSDFLWGIGFTATQAEGNEAEWGSNWLGKELNTVATMIDNGAGLDQLELTVFDACIASAETD